MPQTFNKTDSMANILLLNLQGAYDGKVPKAEEFIDQYKDKSARAIEFAYNMNAAAARA